MEMVSVDSTLLPIGRSICKDIEKILWEEEYTSHSDAQFTYTNGIWVDETSLDLPSLSFKVVNRVGEKLIALYWKKHLPLKYSLVQILSDPVETY